MRSRRILKTIAAAGTMYRNGSGYMGSSVSFSAPAGYSSVRVSASHTISYGTTYFSDSTAEEYHY